MASATINAIKNTQYEGRTSLKSQVRKIFESFGRKSNVQYGYIFCISSEPMNGRPYTDGESSVYYVGYSFNDPLAMIEEMDNNQKEFSLEFSKRIRDPVGTNTMVHYVLDEHDTRIEKGVDFFKRQIFQYYEVDWYVVPFRPHT